jgi:scyllo-inositol 2-dehydrogenase (NADP+)
MKKVKAAILSFGMSGKVFHAPFLELLPMFEFAGAWERSKNELKDYYPSSQRYSSLESILEDQSIDLVVVNTPTYTHFDYAKLALQANKHVVVEKAFTTTVKEALELKALAKSKNLKLSVFQNRRWDSDFKTVKEVYSNGVLGDPIDVSFCFDRFTPALSTKQHKEVKGSGAGIVKDLGPHIIDQALHLFGFPDSLFAKLAITRQHSEVDDYFKILLFYPKFNVELRGGYFFKEPVPSYVIHGTKGSFLKPRGDVQETQLQGGMKPNAVEYGIEPESEFGILNYLDGEQNIRENVKTLPGNYSKYYEAVYHSIVDGHAMPVTADDGIKVMKIIEAAFQSDLEKRVIPMKD